MTLTEYTTQVYAVKLYPNPFAPPVTLIYEATGTPVLAICNGDIRSFFIVLYYESHGYHGK